MEFSESIKLIFDIVNQGTFVVDWLNQISLYLILDLSIWLGEPLFLLKSQTNPLYMLLKWTTLFF